MVHETERAANVHAGFFADLAHGVGDFIDFLIRRAAATVDDAIPDCAGGFRRFRAFNEFFLGHERIAVDRRFGHGRLRAIVTVFGAEPAFGVLQDVDLHALAVVVAAHFERCAHQLRQLFVRRVQYRS